MADHDQRAPSDIHLLTTDVLLADLIGGRAIAVASGTLLTLESDDARAVLDWYRRSKGRWAGNLTADDAEAIVDAIGTSPPILEATSDAGSDRAPEVLRLVKVVAYQFAGLHAYGRSSSAPLTFTFAPVKPVTLFEGANGSGKTSVANAVVWCLTGHLIRSQRSPEEGPTEFQCEILRDRGVVSTHLMSAVTPMPHAKSDISEGGKSIPADTWVEVSFVDSNGNMVPPLRREQTRRANGKLVETPPDLDAIGIDPIAWRIATIMPALLPFLPVGSASQLGQAVARLTGLAELVDLAKHAAKAADRIAKRMTKELQTDLSSIAQRYGQARKDLELAIAEHPHLACETTMPLVNDEDSEAQLRAIANHFVSSKAAALAHARGVLGEAFNADDKAARDDLEANIRPAIELLHKHVSHLPAIARLSALSVDTEAVATTVALLTQIDAEATTLAELSASPDHARRAQLYARVSAWMHEHAHSDNDTCPVCVGPLQGANDPVTGSAVRDHLAEAARDREVIARTVAEWSSHWCGRLIQALPSAIAGEARKDLPGMPADLLKLGLIDELFAADSFSGSLSALREDGAMLVEQRAAGLPPFDEPMDRELPTQLSAQTKPLQSMIRRITRALAFAEWRAANSDALLEFLHAIRRGEEGTADVERAIGRRLSSLLSIVESAAPLNTAIDYIGRMEAARSDYAAKAGRIEACRRAVAALGKLVPLGDLAQTQVNTLRTKLHKRAEHWRKAIYRNATEFAPDLTDTGMDARGILDLKVGRQGVAAPAQHVFNASALRGALLGFFLAFREHVLATRGGLALLIFDDPQELLDNDNRERLARGLSRLARDDAQLIVTSHDRKFARSLVAENRPRDLIEHLSVHPVNAVRPTLTVSPAIEEVDRKRQAFFDNPDSAPNAQDYASDLRVFLESRLGDLFDDVAHPAYAASTKALTLNPLMDKLRGLVTAKTGELFTNPIVRRFVEDKALAEGAEPRRVLNESHHDKASISYMDVKGVETEFDRLRSSIEKVHEQFRLYRWREPNTPAVSEGNTVIVLPHMTKPKFSVPIYPDIAAFVGEAPGGGSQDVETDQLVSDWFDGKALYFVRGDTLGFSIPSGAVAIVDADPYPGEDQNLVVALQRGQVLARRLMRSPGAIGVSLAAQMPDPRVRRPTLTFDESKITLHRIVGAIFTDMAPPKGGGEASQVDSVAELARIAVAYRVKEESAIPIALPGQLILGGTELKATDLDSWEGRLAAVTLDDGSSIFKRVGARLPGKLGHLRQFETIGGLGSSVVVATEVLDESDPVPVMISARRVVGVLYDGA